MDLVIGLLLFIYTLEHLVLYFGTPCLKNIAVIAMNSYLQTVLCCFCYLALGRSATLLLCLTVESMQFLNEK